MVSPAHFSPSFYMVPIFSTRIHLVFQRRRPRTWPGLKLTAQRADKHLYWCTKELAGVSGGEFIACVNWNWLRKKIVRCLLPLPEEETEHSESNKFLTALDGKRVLSSPRCGCLLLQRWRNLLGALGRPVVPVVSTAPLLNMQVGVTAWSHIKAPGSGSLSPLEKLA